jgi:hypothetical protein
MAFFFIVSVLLVFAATRAPSWPEATEHNVRFLELKGPDQWWYTSDEHPLGSMWKACQHRNFKHSKWIFANYFSPIVRYQIQDDCFSIREDGFEVDYWWHDKKDKQAPARAYTNAEVILE